MLVVLHIICTIFANRLVYYTSQSEKKIMGQNSKKKMATKLACSRDHEKCFASLFLHSVGKCLFINDILFVLNSNVY